MNKQQLRELLAKKAAEYQKHKPIHTHAESVDQQKRLHKRCETRKRPAHILQEEWDAHLKLVAEGKLPEYKPGDDIWLTDKDPVTGKLKFEVDQ